MFHIPLASCLWLLECCKLLDKVGISSFIRIDLVPKILVNMHGLQDCIVIGTLNFKMLTTTIYQIFTFCKICVIFVLHVTYYVVLTLYRVERALMLWQL
jgi:hypothetical protein